MGTFNASSIRVGVRSLRSDAVVVPRYHLRKRTGNCAYTKTDTFVPLNSPNNYSYHYLCPPPTRRTLSGYGRSWSDTVKSRSSSDRQKPGCWLWRNAFETCIGKTRQILPRPFIIRFNSFFRFPKITNRESEFKIEGKVGKSCTSCYPHTSDVRRSHSLIC